MDSAVEVPKTLPTIVEEGNKRNEVAEEVVGNKRNEIKRKRGRPSDKDKEGLPVSKKVKKSPHIKSNLKITSTNTNGKPNDFNKLYTKKNPNTEKCIFCQEEYLRETLWEDAGQEKPNIFQIAICKRCHACFRDAKVIKEIREIMKKKQF